MYLSDDVPFNQFLVHRLAVADKHGVREESTFDLRDIGTHVVLHVAEVNALVLSNRLKPTNPSSRVISKENLRTYDSKREKLTSNLP